MTISDVKGSGMANTCPVLNTGTSDVKGALKAGSYKFDKFCIEPTSFQVKEDGNTYDTFLINQ